MPLFHRGHHHHQRSSNRRHSFIPRLTASQYAHLPKALPCTNYYGIYPEDAGPTGTVVIKCREEAQMWALVATPVSEEEEAVQLDGGCMAYVTGDPKHPVQYFHFRNSDDDVFGRSTYQQRPSCGSVVSAPPG
ncbi:hypothetical protein ABB37_09108 [Leptomonas pyrrhocoris]|uniref:Uncharacterized protein n=1 Tax=Leptomonas pyrrhocoris TaxID=157538 RepID=A0A0M9FR74_LEPPY|nr:hypothetical protein ABB37_09108 [Leptomonas pyrrhocoris]KPA74405.1 hypothetical protein ABB37_09108 [Leptomonas pyrrhocoris]|eukprot:XP_015652844.1 hypothetical protein ABB37_09108 [Leptomonas pyrrhocoris]